MVKVEGCRNRAGAGKYTQKVYQRSVQMESDRRLAEGEASTNDVVPAFPLNALVANMPDKPASKMAPPKISNAMNPMMAMVFPFDVMKYPLHHQGGSK